MAGSFHAAVPAPVVLAAVAPVLAVCVVVLPVIGNQIRQRKALIVGHIVNTAMSRRNGDEEPDKFTKDLIVTLDETPCQRLKRVIVLAEMLHGRFPDSWILLVLLLQILIREIVIEQGGAAQHRIRCDGLQRRCIAL